MHITRTALVYLVTRATNLALAGSDTRYSGAFYLNLMILSLELMSAEGSLVFIGYLGTLISLCHPDLPFSLSMEHVSFLGVWRPFESF